MSIRPRRHGISAPGQAVLVSGERGWEMHIIVVERDVVLRRKLCERLERDGHSTVAAATSADAVKAISASAPAVVVIGFLTEFELLGLDMMLRGNRQFSRLRVLRLDSFASGRVIDPNEFAAAVATPVGS